MVRFWKSLEVSSFAVCVVAFLYAIALSMHWFYTASLVPVPQLGKTQEFSIRGKAVYITSEKQYELNGAFLIAFVGAALAGWIEVYKNRVLRR